MKPETPPITNRTMKLAKNRNAVLNTGRPPQIVAVQANTATALGRVMMMRGAAEKNDSDRLGRPVANMWWTQTPNPSAMVATVDSATGV